MTVESHSVRFSPIGAFELKATYQKNMFLGMLSVVLLVAVIIGSIALIKVLTRTDAADAPLIVIKSIADLGPPPSVAKKTVQVRVSQEIAPPSFALPEAVPDEEVVEDFVVVSQEELAEITAPALGDGDGTGDIIIDIPMDDYIPRPDEFVPVEERPQPLKLVKPDYPPMAQKAGIEGTVWVQVLVGKDGNVMDAIIYTESGANAGFEEAAIEAAKKGKWKPAMQNKQPVIVWAAYEIKFTLH
ncbi:MAG: energy transducer TonB [candidate division Zixibacteria bacterium]|nr:energy transducer TonB [candidate division Zixibacteria bacterium]